MSPRDTAVGATPNPQKAEQSMDVFRAFNPSTLLAQQQRTAEALVAGSQKFLEGLQEVTTRSLQLQTALFQQMWAGAASLPLNIPAGASTEHDATAALEATVTSIRDVMTAACKWPMDALAAFHDRIGANSTSAAACSAHASKSEHRKSAAGE